MITRLVKLTFQEEKLDEFLALFNSVRYEIASFPGCIHLKAFTDIRDKSIIFTYSEWASEAALEVYRSSDLFKITWSETRRLFKAPAEAWTVKELS
jgi:autoinducer 2-degrading protein